MKITSKLTAIVFIAAVLFSCFSITASAEDIYANIENINVSVKIPESFSIKSAKVYGEGTLRYSVEAVASDGAQTLKITSEKTDKANDIFNFKYLTEEQITAEPQSIISGNSSLVDKACRGVTNASFQEKNDYIIFLYYSTEVVNNQTLNSAVGYTVINGELVTITYSSSTALTTQQKGLFNSIVDSLTVTELLTKPQPFNLGAVFGTVFIIMLFAVAAVLVLIAVYYKNNSTRSRSRSKLADKYYNELLNEGIVDDNSAAPNKDSSQKPVAAAAVQESNAGISSAMVKWRQPSLIEDEWEDMDLEKMFSVPDVIQTKEPSDDGFGPLTSGPTEFIHGDSTAPEYRPRSAKAGEKAESGIKSDNGEQQPKTSRADSARRYAKLFMGSDVDKEKSTASERRRSAETGERRSSADTSERRRSAETSERRRSTDTSERRRSTERGENEETRHSSNRRNTQSRRNNTSARPHSSTRRRRKQDDVAISFELDGYWDKYR